MGLALQKHGHAAGHVGIFLAAYAVGTGSKAQADVMVQAGPYPVSHRAVCTAPQGKDAMDTFPGFARGLSGGERPEIARAVPFAHLAHHFQPGEVIPLRKPEQHILLVVAQNDIIVRPVLLDQARLKQQRFLFRGGVQRFQRSRVPDHRHGLGRELFLRAKIGKDALAQVARLAHINDLAQRVLVQVHPRRGRYGGRSGTLHNSLTRPATNRYFFTYSSEYLSCTVGSGVG